MKESTLRVESLKKRMPGFMLEASSSLSAHERIAVVSPSGMGKTTLLRLIAGLETPDSGSVILGNRNLTALPVREREIGLVSQEQALFSGRSVYENLAFGLESRKVPREERQARVSAWLAKPGWKSVRRICGPSFGRRSSA